MHLTPTREEDKDVTRRSWHIPCLSFSCRSEEIANSFRRIVYLSRVNSNVGNKLDPTAATGISRFFGGLQLFLVALVYLALACHLLLPFPRS